MIQVKEFPDKQFESKEDLFKALKENKELIVNSKKAKIYESIEKDARYSVVTSQSKIKKAFESLKSFEMDEAYYYFVVNSSNILDSHKDLHIDGNWDKTVKEQQGKVYLVFDHSLKRNDVIGMRQDIEMFTAKIPFKSIGKNYEGESYCLVYKISKDKIINADAKSWLEKGYDLEASVRMMYMDIDLAMNSDAKEDVKELENFNKYYPTIANKEDFENEIYYFWIVKQAKNVQESSLVLFGSNPATGRVQENKDSEAVTDTSKNEPSDDTQRMQRFINNLKI
jgi:hypothetical protein